MKLSITFGLLCMLISEAAALICYNCNNDTHQCYNETCPEGDGYCASRTLVGGYSEVHEQRCFSSHDCISGSINLGFSNYTVNTKCCDGDFCNHQIVPELNRNNTPNGKKCFTCEGGDCNKNLSCVGDEDVCITAMRNYREIVKGCASLDLCLSARHVAYDISWTTCCKGNLCNSKSWPPYYYYGMYPSHHPPDEHQRDPHSNDHDHNPHSNDHDHNPHSDDHYNHDPYSDDHYYDYYRCEGIFCSSTKTVGQSVLLLLGSLLYFLLIH